MNAQDGRNIDLAIHITAMRTHAPQHVIFRQRHELRLLNLLNYFAVCFAVILCREFCAEPNDVLSRNQHVQRHPSKLHDSNHSIITSIYFFVTSVKRGTLQPIIPVCRSASVRRLPTRSPVCCAHLCPPACAARAGPAGTHADPVGARSRL